MLEFESPEPLNDKSAMYLQGENVVASTELEEGRARATHYVEAVHIRERVEMTWPYTIQEKTCVSSFKEVVGVPSPPCLWGTYNGQENLYIPKRTLHKYPMATAFNSYRCLPPYGRMVGKAFSTSCEDMKQDKSLPCEDSNYYLQS